MPCSCPHDYSYAAAAASVAHSRTRPALHLDQHLCTHTALGAVCDLDRPAVAFRAPFHKRESEAPATLHESFAGVRARERIEERFTIRGRDYRAVVVDGDRNVRPNLELLSPTGEVLVTKGSSLFNQRIADFVAKPIADGGKGPGTYKLRVTQTSRS